MFKKGDFYESFCSDVIQLISIIVSAVLTIVSLIISVLALKQSQKSIKLTEQSVLETNRPYLAIYKETIFVSNNKHEYLILKNFGNTGATIESFHSNPQLIRKIDKKQIFEHLSGSFIAPGQSISTMYSINGDRFDDISEHSITIKYSDQISQYENSIIINNDLDQDIVIAKSMTSENAPLQRVIVKATEEYLRHHL